MLMVLQGFSNEILVFLPGGKKSAIKKEISKLASGEVKVFTKANKFLKAMKSNPSAIAIGPGPAIELTKSHKVVLVGKKGSSSGESWVIIAANPDVTLANLSSKKVGLWDVMGRKNVKKFFKSYFGIKVGSTKRVNKFKDLQPLLGMDMVDALALSQSDYEKIKSSTSVKLTVLTKSKKTIPFAQVATSGGDAAAAKNLSKTSKSFLKAFGFESWGAK